MANSVATYGARLPLFVYGTLLPGQPNYGLLRAAAVRLRPASLLGHTLLDLHYYPMMVRQADGTVVGLAVDVAPAIYEAVVDELDFLEGYDSANPLGSDYRREKRVVRLADGHAAVVWTYIGYPATVGHPRIASGDWKRHVRARAAANEAWWANIATVGSTPSTGD